MTAYSLKQASFLVLVHIVDYCGFHFIPGASAENGKVSRINTDRIC